jgi:phytoene synthase
MADLIAFEADRARQWYSTGMQLMPMLDRRSAACTGAMAGIYRRLLEHIAASPQTAMASRMSLPGREKAMIAAAALAGLGRPGKARRPAGARP